MIFHYPCTYTLCLCILAEKKSLPQIASGVTVLGGAIREAGGMEEDEPKKEEIGRTLKNVALGFALIGHDRIATCTSEPGRKRLERGFESIFLTSC